MRFLVALMFLAQEVHGFGIVLLPTDRKGQKLPCIDNFLSEIQNIVYYFSTLFFCKQGIKLCRLLHFFKLGNIFDLSVLNMYSIILYNITLYNVEYV